MKTKEEYTRIRRKRKEIIKKIKKIEREDADWEGRKRKNYVREWRKRKDRNDKKNIQKNEKEDEKEEKGEGKEKNSIM